MNDVTYFALTPWLLMVTTGEYAGGVRAVASFETFARIRPNERTRSAWVSAKNAPTALAFAPLP